MGSAPKLVLPEVKLNYWNCLFSQSNNRYYKIQVCLIKQVGKKMNEYYFLAEKVKSSTAFAYSPGETPLAHELIPDVIRNMELPFGLILKKVTTDKKGLQISDDLSKIKRLWQDYQPNNLAWPLMSERMKNLVNLHLTGKEGISWIIARVSGNNECKEYFIPRFSYKHDVIDEQRTLFIPGTNHIIKPVLSYVKIANYSLFSAPQLYWEITSGLYVSQTLKNAMQKAKLTGVGFEKITVI
jgi:hypothetical protein